MAQPFHHISVLITDMLPVIDMSIASLLTFSIVVLPYSHDVPQCLSFFLLLCHFVVSKCTFYIISCFLFIQSHECVYSPFLLPYNCESFWMMVILPDISASKFSIVTPFSVALCNVCQIYSPSPFHPTCFQLYCIHYLLPACTDSGCISNQANN